MPNNGRLAKVDFYVFFAYRYVATNIIIRINEHGRGLSRCFQYCDKEFTV